MYNNWHGKTSHKNLWRKAFAELRKVNFWNLYKVLDKYSLAKLEAILCDAPSSYRAETAEKEIIDEMLLVRYKKLNRKFEWSKENIERIVTVSNMFLKCWEDGFNRAKKMIDLLYTNGEKKADFYDVYDIDIKLTPEILLFDKETGEYDYPFHDIYSVLMDHQHPEDELVINIGESYYNPGTKDEGGFWDDIHLNHDLSWNIEGFGDIDLAEHYICYAIHILYSHHEWANEDIMKIKNIHVAVEITDGQYSSLF
ncbi:hypothetical protein AGMMS50230_21760 [Spirochaetia bacterium]|nr:hypothetical protein AGMMS50230_21760 [Spirochaetia bacterium]